ncbi:MAG: beta-galactosidase trimerization domain-containing protein, partial [Lachnospiraceae bacterium]|nr:beta-galactosidase trimerization domain-containing protein [Lachnospiraceae bacterium]
PARIAMAHDLMRGVSGGAPFLLMEQTPSVTNWLPYNALKRPGVMRLWSWQAVAHGSDSVLFFQMRRSMGNCEKLHGAVIDHVGTGETRVFREIKALGKELEALGRADSKDGNFQGSFGRTPAKAALYFDWNNWWGIHQSAGPSTDLNYIDEFYSFYRAFHRANIPVDIVGPEDDLSGYKILAAPVLYMVPGTDALSSISNACGSTSTAAGIRGKGTSEAEEKAVPRGKVMTEAGDTVGISGEEASCGYDEKIRAFVWNGGTFVTTFFSGIVDDNDLVHLGGYPGPLRDILGIWVEETDALPREAENHFSWDGKRYPGKLVCDLLHTEGAEAVSDYEEDFYAGMPALTQNRFGEGQAWYVATASDGEFYDAFVKRICEEAGVQPALGSLGDAWNDVEATAREIENTRYLFILNHANEPRCVTLPQDGTALLVPMKNGQTQDRPAEQDGVREQPLPEPAGDNGMQILAEGAALSAGTAIILPPHGVQLFRMEK